jgi:hypothetical protein
MAKFIAKLLLNVTKNGDASRSEFDVQFRMVIADDRDEAIAKADALGQFEEGSATGPEAEMPAWKYIGISELIEIEDAEDGALLFSETLHHDEPDGLIEYTRLRNAHIRTKNLIFG